MRDGGLWHEEPADAAGLRCPSRLSPMRHPLGGDGVHRFYLNSMVNQKALPITEEHVRTGVLSSDAKVDAWMLSVIRKCEPPPSLSDNFPNNVVVEELVSVCLVHGSRC